LLILQSNITMATQKTQEAINLSSTQAKPTTAPVDAVITKPTPEMAAGNEASSLFSNSLEQGTPQATLAKATVETKPSVDITKEAMAKIKDLQEAGFLSPKVAESLIAKLSANGSGLMGQVKPESVLATLKAVEELKNKGFSAEAVKAITSVGFGKGGLAGIEKYLTEIKGVTPDKLKDHIQSNNANSVVWLIESEPNIFDVDTLTFIDAEAMIRAAKAKAQEVLDNFIPAVGSMVSSVSSKLRTGFDNLLSFISKGEGGYNSMNQGTSNGQIVGSTHDASTILGKDLTNMTVGEVMSLQSSGKLFAAGRYQIIPSTMQEAMRYSGINPNERFSPENQDKLAISLIKHKRPELGRYLDGKHNDIRLAMKEMAREWASVPDPDTGASYYGSGNASHHSVEEVKAALISARGGSSRGILV
jgi:muramidase (phage lysozyme)